MKWLQLLLAEVRRYLRHRSELKRLKKALVERDIRAQQRREAEYRRKTGG